VFPSVSTIKTMRRSNSVWHSRPLQLFSATCTPIRLGADGARRFPPNGGSSCVSSCVHSSERFKTESSRTTNV
jgi:hypothetical protein